MSTSTTPSPAPIPVTPDALPFACPPPSTPGWNMHPKVYLPLDAAPNGEAQCPYCGARYVLVAE